MNATSRPLMRVLGLLEGVRKSSQGGYSARCPGAQHEHADRHPSLSVGIGADGRVLLNCHAGCTTEEVLAALELDYSDLYEKTPSGNRVRRFRVADRNGSVLAHHVREDRANGKQMWWEINGKRGLGGTPSSELPLYRLPELLAADPAAPVFATEGEAASDALADLGLVAVATVTGAGGTPSVHVLEPLQDRDVILWADNDDQGRAHMQRVAACLRRPPRWVDWPDAPAKGDAADYVKSGGTREGLQALIRVVPATPESYSVAPPVGPAETNFRWYTAFDIGSQVMAETTWRAHGLLADGSITELDGKVKRAGKTTLILALSRAVLTGEDFLGKPTARSEVVYLTEQGPRTFREALRRAGLLERRDLHVLYWHDTRGQEWQHVVAEAVAKCHATGAHVLVIDTLSQFVGLRGDAENSSGDALLAVQPLQEAVASDHALAVLFSRHERKAGGEVGDSGRGSSAFAGAVDIVLSLRRPEGYASPTQRVLHALSRFDETPDSLVIELKDQHYVALGDESVLSAEAARKAILDALPSDVTGAKPAEEILNVADVRRTLGKSILNDLVRQEVVQRVGAGKRNDAYRFFRPDSWPRDGGGGEAAEPGLPEPQVGLLDRIFVSAGPPLKEIATETNCSVGSDGDPADEGRF